MTNTSELDAIWLALADTYQQINRTTSKAHRTQLEALAEMLRVDYRKLTSIYYS